MSLDFAPATESAEISQNVRIIMATVRGSQPLNRSLGIDGGIVDAPGTRGRALLTSALIEQLPRQEPRIDVKSVNWSGDFGSGEYEPRIEYEVIG